MGSLSAIVYTTHGHISSMMLQEISAVHNANVAWKIHGKSHATNSTLLVELRIGNNVSGIGASASFESLALPLLKVCSPLPRMLNLAQVYARSNEYDQITDASGPHYEAAAMQMHM